MSDRIVLAAVAVALGSISCGSSAGPGHAHAGAGGPGTVGGMAGRRASGGTAGVPASGGAPGTSGAGAKAGDAATSGGTSNFGGGASGTRGQGVDGGSSSAGVSGGADDGEGGVGAEGHGEAGQGGAGEGGASAGAIPEPPIPAGCTVTVVTGDRSVTTADALEALRGVTRIEGSLALGGSVDDLSALACLTWVGGELSVVGANQLRQVALPALGVITRSLMVYQDSSLDAVELPALDYVGADGTASVTIQILPELSQVKLGKLQEIPAGLSVNGVGHTSGAGLQLDFGALRKVGGPLYFQNDLGLTSLDGFGALREIGGALFIASTDVQTVALPELRAIGRMLDVELDTSLVTLDLPALDTVGSVQSSSVRLAALGKLGSADFRSIREVPMDLELSSLGTTNTSDLRLDFSSLKHIGGTLRVEGLSNLATLDGFAALETIAGAASIVADAGLSTLELPMLTTIGGTLSVSLDEDLTSIGFDGLTGVGYLDGTSVTFSSLPELTSLSVKKLPEVPSGLSFSVIGTTADGDLALDFAALAGVRGNLTVTSVKNLTTLDGFESLATVDGTLSVTSNANLPTCAATTLRDRVGAAQSTVSGNLVDACSP